MNVETTTLFNSILNKNVLYIIDSYLSDIKFIENYKNNIKKVFNECAIKSLINNIQYQDELLDYAFLNYDDSYDEFKYGPSGDYGNYMALPYNKSVIDIILTINDWNNFVKMNESLKDLLPICWKKKFKSIELINVLKNDEDEEFINKVINDDALVQRSW